MMSVRERGSRGERERSGIEVRRGTPRILLAAFAAIALAAACDGGSSQEPPVLSTAPDSLVLDWNETAMMVSPSAGPYVGMRALAMTHVAIYDTVAAFDGHHRPYHATATPPAGASPRAAAAAAAYFVLTSVYTGAEQVGMIQTRYDGQLAEIEDGPAKDDGIAFGRSVAEAIVEHRSTDGSMGAMSVPHADGTAPGEWRRTASGDPMAPGWGDVTPWTMTACDQLDQGGPPALNSTEYAAAYDEVRRLGATSSTERTEEQTAIATFWDPHVPGKWAGAARAIAREEGLSLMASARLFAQVATALADSIIASMNMMYGYNFWRPETAILLAADDGNDATSPQADWQPLMASPAVPEYVSGHGLTSAAVAGVLRRHIGEDHHHFSLASMGSAPRTYDSFGEAAEEAGRSRVWAGVQFGFSSDHAVRAGFALAEHVCDEFFLPE